MAERSKATRARRGELVPLVPANSPFPAPLPLSGLFSKIVASWLALRVIDAAAAHEGEAVIAATRMNALVIRMARSKPSRPPRRFARRAADVVMAGTRLPTLVIGWKSRAEVRNDENTGGRPTFAENQAARERPRSDGPLRGRPRHTLST